MKTETELNARSEGWREWREGKIFLSKVLRRVQLLASVCRWLSEDSRAAEVANGTLTLKSLARVFFALSEVVSFAGSLVVCYQPVDPVAKLRAI